jgi:hypothetical protein
VFLFSPDECTVQSYFTNWPVVISVLSQLPCHLIQIIGHGLATLWCAIETIAKTAVDFPIARVASKGEWNISKLDLFSDWAFI